MQRPEQQQVQRRRGQQHQQAQQLAQVRQQVLEREQEPALLFCHKRPEQRQR